MIEYIVGDRGSYGFSYQETRDKYLELCHVKDDEFLARLPEALHLACFVCWVKETTQHACADNGVIHELIHLLHLPNDTDLAKVRELFKTAAMLA